MKNQRIESPFTKGEIYYAIGVNQFIEILDIERNFKSENILSIKVTRNGFTGLHDLAEKAAKRSMLNPVLYTKEKPESANQ